MVTHELLVTIAIFEISGNIPSDVKSTKVLPLMGEQQHRPLLPQPPEQSTQDHWHIQAIDLPTHSRHFGYWAHIFASPIISSGRDFHMIVVLDEQYLPMSIKDSTHSKRTKKSKTSKGNWQSCQYPFLCQYPFPRQTKTILRAYWTWKQILPSKLCWKMDYFPSS